MDAPAAGFTINIRSELIAYRSSATCEQRHE